VARTLTGHVARGNPHGALLQSAPALAIFHGPHACVSPAWYGTHPSVPTWNYAVVHARGSVRLIDNDGGLDRTMVQMVDHFEAGRADRWHMALPADYRARMQGGIVAFEIEIAQLTAKLKLSPNRPGADRPRVAAALEAGDAEAQAVARLMREHLDL
jgi:transcriptional regulator